MASTSALTRSAEIRHQLTHPVIDTDGHFLEVTEVLLDYIHNDSGAQMVDRFLAEPSIRSWHANHGMCPGNSSVLPAVSMDERRRKWLEKPIFWTHPQGNTLDHATAMLPALMHERLDEMGIDVTILYPTLGLMCLGIIDDELRPAVCRAFNTYYADLLAPYKDRMLPVALIPMGTPEEAVEALHHSVATLGYRAVTLSAWATRAVEEQDTQATGRAPYRPESFALDSDSDYDKVWRTCVELRVAPTFHGIGIGRGFGSRGSVSSYMFNTAVTGGFATWAQYTCGSLLFGGVPHRFPTLNFSFLEGGAAWACGLLSSVLGKWQKRNGDAMRRNLDPKLLDHALLEQYIQSHGDRRTVQALPEYMRSLKRAEAPAPEGLDEFLAMGVSSSEELVDQFVSRFFFGCEGDDPNTAFAFHDALPFGRKLQVTYGSDISHWDVSDMSEVLGEAYEPVECGFLTKEQFRAFVFDNPVRLHAGMNADFFRGTRVETAVKQALAAQT